MATLARMTRRWMVVLAACHVGIAMAEADSGTAFENGKIVSNGVSELATIDCSACRGVLGRYASASMPDYEGTIWSEAPKAPVRQVWTVDYRVRPMFDSFTSYEFGTIPGAPEDTFAPLSRLDWDLDSTWHGLQIGVEFPDLRLHFEWLTPMQRRIDGVMADYDWNIFAPQDDPTRLDSLTHSSQRWCDGQMLELGTEFKLSNSFFDLPVEFWPTAGFRFQRFDIAAHGITQLVPPVGHLPEYDGVDVITFSQQYYVVYFGGQFHRTVLLGWIPIDVIFQVDGGPAAGYNIDHHLLREGERYTIEETTGGVWHMGFHAEAHMSPRLSVGFQADYMEIHTTGTHRWLNEPYDIDVTWDNGVKVKSNQMTMTGFVRYRF